MTTLKQEVQTTDVNISRVENVCIAEGTMEGERPPPAVPPVPRSRAFRQFKNPPQPHMCICDTLRDSSEKLYINVLGWQKIPNPKQYSDPIPLYGGMKVPQGCTPNSNKPPLIVFAVMVNPEILKVNGKNAANPGERDALVSLLCDFVEAMNPGLRLARRPVVLQERDLAGELKDVWLAVQAKREREKGMSQDYVYKVYDIDGVSPDEMADEEGISLSYSDAANRYPPPQDPRKNPGNCTSQPLRDPRAELEELDHYQSSQCSSAFRSYAPSEEREAPRSLHDNNSLSNYRYKHPTDNTSAKDANSAATGWDEFSKRDISTIKNGDVKQKNSKKSEHLNNGKETYNFFPVFHTPSDGGGAGRGEDSGRRDPPRAVTDNTDKIIDPMQKLGLHSTDNKNCDNKTSEFSSISS